MATEFLNSPTVEDDSVLQAMHLLGTGVLTLSLTVGEAGSSSPCVPLPLEMDTTVREPHCVPLTSTATSLTAVSAAAVARAMLDVLQPAGFADVWVCVLNAHHDGVKLRFTRDGQNIEFQEIAVSPVGLQ